MYVLICVVNWWNTVITLSNRSNNQEKLDIIPHLYAIIAKYKENPQIVLQGVWGAFNLTVLGMV